jgi:hypothetical protein
LRSGIPAIVFEQGAVAAVDVRGGGTGAVRHRRSPPADSPRGMERIAGLALPIAREIVRHS